MDTMEMEHKKFSRATKKSFIFPFINHPIILERAHFTEGNCINFALPADCGGKQYLETLDKALGAG